MALVLTDFSGYVAHVKRGEDIAARFPGLYLVHHNLPGKEVEPHDHPEHLLFVPLVGELTVHLQSKNLTCGPGEMIYLPPKTTHAFSSSTHGGDRLIALIDAKVFTQVFEPKKLTVNTLGKELLFYLLLHPKTKHGKGLVEVFIQTLAETLETASETSEFTHLAAKISDARIRKALEYLEENMTENIDVEELAKASGLSVRSLNRNFLLHTGMTPKQAVQKMRIEKAKTLLSTPGASVTETAYAVGFQSLSRFIHTFQKYTGELPSEFMRR